jgi:hypothetical protein
VLDVIKLVKYRADFYGGPMQGVTHEAMRGPSTWSVGDRELMAAFVAKTNQCEFCTKAHAAVALEQTIGRPWSPRGLSFHVPILRGRDVQLRDRRIPWSLSYLLAGTRARDRISLVLKRLREFGLILLPSMVISSNI